MISLNRIVSSAAVALALTASHAAFAEPIKNIVLVHGYFADGSGWQGVAKILTRDGYTVSVVQQPETTFADDVKATQSAVNGAEGRSLLVGHSYGGMVITQAGDDPKVAGLVYVAAFEPEVGETLRDLTSKIPAATKGIKPTPDGHLMFDQPLFNADFAAGVPEAEANFMAVSQVLPSIETANAKVTQAAWKTKPSWAVVSKDDRTVNPDLERFMAKRAGSTVTEIHGSHVAFIVHPAEVAKVIEQAAVASGKG